MNDWVQTFTGKKLNWRDPDPNDINIEDIAHSLSLQCRFNGHCSEFYSVAEHCVRMSSLHTKHREWMLMHDAAEAYLGDIPLPIKRGLPVFNEIEERILFAIQERFFLEKFPKEYIAAADEILLATEKRDLLLYVNWEITLPFPLAYKIVPWTAREAEERFLTVAEFLGIK